MVKKPLTSSPNREFARISEVVKKTAKKKSRKKGTRRKLVGVERKINTANTSQKKQAAAKAGKKFLLVLYTLSF